jgi:hypothetical protein
MFGNISGVRFGLAALGLALGSTVASAVEFNEIARFDVSFAFDADLNNDNNPDGMNDNPKFIGNNSLAIAWNGSKLYIAGFDNVSAYPGVGIIEMLNTSATGLVTSGDADFSAKFGALTPPVSRGYTGLAIKGNRLAASYDPGGAPEPAPAAGIQLFDTSANSLVWNLSASTPSRAGSGVAFDPGFNGAGAGQGVAWTNFGQGRRALLNEGTGAEVHGFTGSASPGFIWVPTLPVGNTNTARDMDFDPDTGDAYVRRSNDVDKAIRSGNNASSSQSIIVDAIDAPFILGQKLEFLSNTVDGDLIIYNDRPSNAAGAQFTDAVKVIDKNGAAQTATYNLISGTPIAAGVSLYDFDFDPVSQTLAVMDFANRNVHLFKVGPVTPPPSGVLGDYDNNGTVGTNDYAVWAANFGGASSTLFNVNPAKVGTTVDASDYTIYRDQLPASVAAASAVPEPAAMLIVSLVAGLGVIVRRRK